MSLVMGNRESHDWRLTLQTFNIFLTIKGGFPKNLTITLRHFKNIKNNQPVTITLITNAQEPNLSLFAK
jgi:hypothetical protein